MVQPFPLILRASNIRLKCFLKKERERVNIDTLYVTDSLVKMQKHKTLECQFVSVRYFANINKLSKVVHLFESMRFMMDVYRRRTS